MNSKFAVTLIILIALGSSAMSQDTRSYWLDKGFLLINDPNSSVKDYSEAEDYFNKSLQIAPSCELPTTTDPLCAKCCYGKGVALENGEKHNHEEALKYLDKALGMNSSYVEALSERGFVLAFALERPEEGLMSVQKALDINPSFCDAWNNKGNVYFYLEKFNEALECYNKAIECDPKCRDCWYNKGYILNESGRYAEANYAFAKSAEYGGRTAW